MFILCYNIGAFGQLIYLTNMCLDALTCVWQAEICVNKPYRPVTQCLNKPGVRYTCYTMCK